MRKSRAACSRKNVSNKWGCLRTRGREPTGDTPSGSGGWSSLTMANSAGMAARLWYGGFPLQQLDHGASDAPDVRGGGGARELDDLRGHPVGRADDLGLLVRSGEGARRTPKSASLTVPSLVVRMLAPLMSRWMTP